MGAIEDIAELVKGINDRKLVQKLKEQLAKLKEEQDALTGKNWEYLAQIRALKEAGGSDARQLGDYLEEIRQLREQVREQDADQKKTAKINALTAELDVLRRELDEEQLSRTRSMNDEIDIEPSISFDNAATCQRHYVLDTSVIIQTPQIIEELLSRGYRTYIPLSVLKELDSMKNSSDPEIALNSRKASAYIYECDQSKNKRWHTASQTSINKNIYICDKYEPMDELASQADNRILGTAIWLQRALNGKTRYADRHNPIIDDISLRVGARDQLILLTADTNLRLAAERHGIVAKVWAKK